MAYKIEQLSLGGILDQAIAIVKNHFGLLFLIMLLLLIPYTLITGLTIVSMTPSLPPQPTMQDYASVRQAQADHWPLFLGLGIVNMLLIYPLTNAAVIHAVARVYLGQPIGAVGAYQHALKRFFPLMGTNFLMMLAVWLGLILCVIPGIYFSIWYGLSQHVVVIEEIAGMAALRRSKKLVNPLRGKFLALGVIMVVITLGVSWSANFIPQPHLRVVASSLLSGITAMLWTAAFVVFYFSCRCALENFDLHYLAESIEADSPAGSTTL